MKSSNSSRKVLVALDLAACATFAQAPVADSTKSVDTARAAVAKQIKKIAKTKAAEPAAEQANAVDGAKASEPANTGMIRGAKSCDDLKEKIAAKMESKGVKGAVLTVTPKDEAGKSGKIVGSCEGGSKKIVYTRG